MPGRSHVRRRAEDRLTFNVPGVSGNYANERITFGFYGPGETPDLGYFGITALLEAPVPAGAVLELWLAKNAPPANPGTAANTSGGPQGAGGGAAAVPGAPSDSDYAYSGQFITSGSATWPLASWRGAQLRLRSGGTPGAVTVSAAAD
jgi:hypothetical protein